VQLAARIIPRCITLRECCLIAAKLSTRKCIFCKHSQAYFNYDLYGAMVVIKFTIKRPASALASDTGASDLSKLNLDGERPSKIARKQVWVTNSASVSRSASPEVTENGADDDTGEVVSGRQLNPEPKQLKVARKQLRRPGEGNEFQRQDTPADKLESQSELVHTGSNIENQFTNMNIDKSPADKSYKIRSGKSSKSPLALSQSPKPTKPRFKSPKPKALATDQNRICASEPSTTHETVVMRGRKARGRPRKVRNESFVEEDDGSGGKKEVVKECTDSTAASSSETGQAPLPSASAPAPAAKSLVSSTIDTSDDVAKRPGLIRFNLRRSRKPPPSLDFGNDSARASSSTARPAATLVATTKSTAKTDSPGYSMDTFRASNGVLRKGNKKKGKKRASVSFSEAGDDVKMIPNEKLSEFEDTDDENSQDKRGQRSAKAKWQGAPKAKAKAKAKVLTKRKRGANKTNKGKEESVSNEVITKKPRVNKVIRAAMKKANARKKEAEANQNDDTADASNQDPKQGDKKVSRHKKVEQVSASSAPSNGASATEAGAAGAVKKKKRDPSKIGTGKKRGPYSNIWWKMDDCEAVRKWKEVVSIAY
jgi:hypothetical protein